VGGQTGGRIRANSGRAESVPAGSGPQNTPHQVPYHLVAFSHVLSNCWTFPSNYNFSGKTKIFPPSRTSPDIDPRTPPPRSAMSQSTFLPNRLPLRKIILGSIRHSEALSPGTGRKGAPFFWGIFQSRGCLTPAIRQSGTITGPGVLGGVLRAVLVSFLVHTWCLPRSGTCIQESFRGRALLR